MERPVQMLNSSEKTALGLRAAYSSYGYRPFKMNKFEEYDLYAENRSFLVSGKVITFTDINGKLMALKPDITLSVVKSVQDCEELVKVCYDENVYRAEKGGREFKEIVQAGLECIGDVDLYCEGEVVLLALKSLALVSDTFLLSISHMAYLTGVLDETGLDTASRLHIYKCICAKSKMGVESLCRKFDVDDRLMVVLMRLAELYQPLGQALDELQALSVNKKTDAAVDELRGIFDLLKSEEQARLYIDFSIESDDRYYNGVIFQGFVQGSASCVLSGGRYDGLMQKFGKKGGAIGFAVYLNLLEDLTRGKREYDIDVLLVYDDKTDPHAVTEQMRSLIACGKSVKAQKGEKTGLRYRQMMRMVDGEAKVVE